MFTCIWFVFFRTETDLCKFVHQAQLCLCDVVKHEQLELPLQIPQQLERKHAHLWSVYCKKEVFNGELGDCIYRQTETQVLLLRAI